MDLQQRFATLGDEELSAIAGPRASDFTAEARVAALAELDRRGVAPPALEEIAAAAEQMRLDSRVAAEAPLSWGIPIMMVLLPFTLLLIPVIAEGYRSKGMRRRERALYRFGLVWFGIQVLLVIAVSGFLRLRA